MSSKEKIHKDKFFDQEVMKNARAGAQYWYEEIWQNVGKCVFCDLSEKYIIHEKDGIVLTTNLFPYIDGQLMIIPRKHIKSEKSLTQHEWELLRMYSYVAKKMFREIYGYKDMWFLLREGGVNAQKTVTNHLHVQLIPFDSPDLAKWNYRKLKFTPLENAQKYQNEIELIEKKIQKFESKYSTKVVTPVIAVDAFLINNRNEILMGKKANGYKKDKDVWVLPGGRVESLETLEMALRREILEETGIDINEQKYELINSILTDTKFTKAGGRVQTERFLINTYKIRVNKAYKLKPGDDLSILKWIDIKEVKKLDTIFDKKLLEQL